MKVYVDFAEASTTLTDEAVFVETDSRSFELRVAAADGNVHVLRRGNLHADIEGGKAKRGKGRIIVTLQKKDAAMSWFSLQAGATGAGGGAAGDD